MVHQWRLTRSEIIKAVTKFVKVPENLDGTGVSETQTTFVKSLCYLLFPSH